VRPSRNCLLLEGVAADEGGAVGEDPEEPHYEEKTCDAAEGDPDDSCRSGAAELVAASYISCLTRGIVVVALDKEARR
jgi:hypothetical protein